MSVNEFSVPEAAVFNSNEYSGNPDGDETIVRDGQVWPRYVFDRDGRLCDLDRHVYVPKRTNQSNTLEFPEETNIEMVREHLGILDF